MSTLILGPVWPLQLPTSAKFVLVSLADNANDSGWCWPSIAYICTRTCLKKTAVIEAIKYLEGVGLITADRDNGRHSRYQINLAALGQGSLFPKPVRETDRSGKRTGPPAERDRSAKRTAPVRQTDTNRQGTVKEPKAPPMAAAEVEIPDFVRPSAWAGFLEMRKANRHPVTPFAAELLLASLNTLREAGHDANEVLNQSTRNGWRDLYPVTSKTPPSRVAAARSVAGNSPPREDTPESRVANLDAWARQQIDYGLAPEIVNAHVAEIRRKYATV